MIKSKRVCEKQFWEVFLKTKQNKVSGECTVCVYRGTGEDMHKEVKVLFEPDIKRKKRNNISIILKKISLPLLNTYIINSKVKQFYFITNNYDWSFNDFLAA